MTQDGSDEDRGAVGAGRAAAARDERRAAALRANLRRRKAQARGRADLAAEPKLEGSPGRDSRPD